MATPSAPTTIEEQLARQNRGSAALYERAQAIFRAAQVAAHGGGAHGPGHTQAFKKLFADSQIRSGRSSKANYLRNRPMTSSGKRMSKSRSCRNS